MQLVSATCEWVQYHGVSATFEKWWKWSAIKSAIWVQYHDMKCNFLVLEMDKIASNISSFWIIIKMKCTQECNLNTIPKYWVQLFGTFKWTKITKYWVHLRVQNHYLEWVQSSATSDCAREFNQYSVRYVSKDVIILFFVKQFNNLSEVHLAQ